MPSLTNRSKEARKLLKEYEEAERIANTIYWHKAKAIYFLKKDNLWKYAVGDSGGSWASFCAEILKCPVVTADHRATNYEFYIINHQFSQEDVVPYDTYSLYYIAISTKGKPKDDVKRIMDDSLLLARKDFLANLRGDECDHQHTHDEMETTVICDDCHRKLLKKKK